MNDRPPRPYYSEYRLRLSGIAVAGWEWFLNEPLTVNGVEIHSITSMIEAKGLELYELKKKLEAKK